MKITDIVSVVMGHAVADAMGVPVEFRDREYLSEHPVTKPLGFGTHGVPRGFWSDDTSMAIAALDSLAEGYFDPTEVMLRFGDWYFKGDYTPGGEMFDVGGACSQAITNFFAHDMPIYKCGMRGEGSCGNGSLMRIYPFVLYLMMRDGRVTPANMNVIFTASSITHAHERAMLGCGIYAFILSELIEKPDKASVKSALEAAERAFAESSELRHYERLFSSDFPKLPENKIKSSGYVVDTLEAAVWCLLNTSSYSECVLTAVNLGDDTDTVAAVAGALGGVLYGICGIPQDWLSVLVRREQLLAICQRAYDKWSSMPGDMRLIDMHTHILPGFDDGAADIGMSEAMLRMSMGEGVYKLFATSHSEPELKTIDDYGSCFSELIYMAREKFPTLSIFSGCEIYITEANLKNVISGLKAGVIPTLAGSRYVLCEFSVGEERRVIKNSLLKLLHLGYLPIIAHAERYLAFEDTELARELCSLGIKIQANAYSLCYEGDSSIKSRARALLSGGYIHFIGSDAHRTNHRPPSIIEGVRYIYATLPRHMADKIAFENAEALLLGKLN